LDVLGLGQFEHVLRGLGHAVRPIFTVVLLHPGAAIQYVKAVAAVDVTQGTDGAFRTRSPPGRS
jgi:hypothetical protein